MGARTKQKRVIDIGSPRASLEANFALQRLVGADSFDMDVGAGPQAAGCGTRDPHRGAIAELLDAGFGAG